jgi:ADP-heptose:LPS heptosyltransferase
LKILIIRFSSIGDIILTTPVIRCIKQQIENVSLHYVSKKTFKPILENNPYLDRCFYLENSLTELIRQLKAENYDYVIDLHNNLRSWRIKQALGVKSFSFRKLNPEKWLLVNLGINKLPAVHIVDRYMEAVKPLGVKNDLKGLDYFIPEEEKVSPGSLPESHRQGYIAFVIGGQHSTKKLPNKKIISVCKGISKPILLLGGKEDRENGYIITNAVGARVYNACGIYSINQSAHLLQNASSVITHDTGLMHIAAALGKKIISVWGSTVPGFGMYPYLKGRTAEYKIVEVKGLKCRPCSKIGFSKCPRKHFNCMNLIRDEDILNAL